MKHCRVLFALIAGLSLSLLAHAEQEGPWKRHVIDDFSDGADGVRLADANGDGLMDIVTGWEEGGVVRMYLNPGPEKSKDKWPAVTVGKARNVEDAVMVDLDGDGAMDVVSCCEGGTKTMYVHWGPKDKSKLLDEKSWVTEAIPATAGAQLWMFCLPMQVDGKRGIDLVVGSKSKNAAVGWLESPGNPRDLSSWQYHKVCDAGWIMSLEPVDRNGHASVFVTDRKGSTRGVYLLEPPLWTRTDFELGKAEYMFGHVVRTNENAVVGYAVATRNGQIQLYMDPVISGNSPQASYVPNPFGIINGKAVAFGRIDGDDVSDIVVTHNNFADKADRGKHAVAWIRVQKDKDPKDWPAYDISGPEGKKFDRVELIDMDGDGDLDVLTCEEIDNLGVFWYENPLGR